MQQTGSGEADNLRRFFAIIEIIAIIVRMAAIAYECFVVLLSDPNLKHKHLQTTIANFVAQKSKGANVISPAIGYTLNPMCIKRQCPSLNGIAIPYVKLTMAEFQDTSWFNGIMENVEFLCSG